MPVQTWYFKNVSNKHSQQYKYEITGIGVLDYNLTSKT